MRRTRRARTTQLTTVALGFGLAVTAAWGGEQWGTVRSVDQSQKRIVLSDGTQFWLMPGLSLDLVGGGQARQARLRRARGQEVGPPRRGDELRSRRALRSAGWRGATVLAARLGLRDAASASCDEVSSRSMASRVFRRDHLASGLLAPEGRMRQPRIQLVRQYTPILRARRARRTSPGPTWTGNPAVCGKPGWSSSRSHGAALATDRETTQSKREHVLYWATGLGRRTCRAPSSGPSTAGPRCSWRGGSLAPSVRRRTRCSRPRSTRRPPRARCAPLPPRETGSRTAPGEPRNPPRRRASRVMPGRSGGPDETMQFMTATARPRPATASTPLGGHPRRSGRGAARRPALHQADFLVRAVGQYASGASPG